MLARLALAILVGILGFARYFYRRQNGPSGLVGGPISRAKALWLAYTLGAWFLAPLLFVATPSVDTPLRIVFALHLASWWLRGPLELVMIYKWLNWTPVYGISHDVAHIMTVFLGTSWALAVISDAGMRARPMNLVAFAFLAIIIFTTVAEILFAALFFATRDKTGHLIYFADDTERYRLINRFTAVVCAVAYSHLALQVGALYFYGP